MDLDLMCLLIIGGIFLYFCNQKLVLMEKQEKEKEKNEALSPVRMEEVKRQFEQSLSNLFKVTSDYQYGYYPGTINLRPFIDEMYKMNEQLKKLPVPKNEEIFIRKCADIVSTYENFCEKVTCFSTSRMFDPSDYGKENKKFWLSVRTLTRKIVEEIVRNNEYLLDSNDVEQIFAIDLELALKCVWFFAMEKPYSALDSQRAIKICLRLYRRKTIDIVLAELFAIKQMSGETAVFRERVRELLKNERSVQELVVFASAFMWMNAYQEESMVLQYMLSKGMQMDVKAQERLHALSVGRGKAPSGFDVTSSNMELYFDVSALTWTDDEYTGLFENLAFQDKILSYSLAVRDEDKELFITQEIKIPELTLIASKIKAVFSEEYGDAVTAEPVTCNALSGCGEERLTGILAVSKECIQMGIFVHIAHIGKKLNIKFYTLFIPTETKNLSVQRQQVLSLLKKLSPAITMWESSLKDTILLATEQLLNTCQAGNGGENSSANREVPMFF